jgi:tetratricopeptide (TPR) repeat protein
VDTATEGSSGTPVGRGGRTAAVLFTVAFAFLLASFPARNPDLWGHLAAGRDLAHGRLAAANTYWTAEAKTGSGWLYNLAAYALYSAVGGAGLVLVKAAVVVVTTLILLRLSRTRPGWLLPAFGTGLAVLALSPRALLQPVTVSYLLLALTLWLLWRPRPTDRPAPLLPWPLLALFLIWANTDRWFPVGLGVVALSWLGQIMDGPWEGRAGFARYAGRSLVALAVVCLVNPGHVHAFGLVLGPGAASPATWPAASPFRSAGLDALHRTPAEFAYFALLGLGLVSFLLALPRWRWARVLPWAALAALSAVQVRAVPFFAVVAGPVLAWNLQDFFARRADWAVPRRGRLAVRGLVGLLGLAFLACAWPGWLQTPPFEPRRWAIETAPALRRGGEEVARWHADGRFGPSDRGLHVSPETAFAFAWFCPSDQRVEDGALAAGVLTESDPAAALRAAGVHHLVVYDPDRERLSAALARLLSDPGQWPLLVSEGDVAVFGWRDPARAGAADPFSGRAVDFDRLALHPGPGEKAPPTRPAREPEPRLWWEAFWKAAPPRPVDRDEAAFRLLYAEAVRGSAGDRHLFAWQATRAAGLVGGAATALQPGALLDAHTRLAFFLPPTGPAGPTGPIGRLGLYVYRSAFVPARDDSPIAVLYLAVRAARRALAADPQDAGAHAALGEAYLRLLHNTRERAWARQLPELGQLRRAQAAAALTRAVALNPDLAAAHQDLAALYGDAGYLDLALKHQRAYIQAARQSALRPGVDRSEFREAVADAERQLGALAQAVEAQERAYLQEASGLRVFDRAILARDRGLVGRSLDVLLASDISAFGANGMALELDLLVRTGRAKEVRDWTDTEHEGALGPMYHWLRALALAASGDYAPAQGECELLAVGGTTAGQPRALMAALVAREVLDELPAVGDPGWSLLGRALLRNEFPRQAAELATDVRRAADATVLRGLIALEAGDVEEAEAAFRRALETWRDEASAASGRGLDFSARPVAQGCLKWIEAGRPG